MMSAELYEKSPQRVDASVAPEPTAPERIGQYELVFRLASGGMATVYLARTHDVSMFNRVVALKRIHRDLIGEPGYREMFLDEARIAFQIAHPNVCTVFEFGEADGEYYLAMEYLVGEPLARLMNRVAKAPKHRSSSDQALKMARIIAGACAGLHAAHELKNADGRLLEVVHRDVTPRNLFVTYGGTVQVVDFGIASARLRLRSTSTEQLRGNVAYMAPEQFTGSPSDRRVDIWALGVTLWEMLAMQRLFKRDTPMTTIPSVVYDEIRPPSECRAHIPKELDEIVLKALQRDPGKRWGTAGEMGLALREFLDTQQEVIGPADLSEWMASLFPQGEARKKRLIEMARLGRSSVASRRPGRTK
jgi:serine/threonine-protein kinase